MLDGAAYVHQPWVLHTVANGGSALDIWPTPTKWLQEETPASYDKRTANINVGRFLSVEVQRWPTPTKTDFKGSSKPGQRRGQLTEALEPNNPGRLNPDWVELLMGFPPGWTSLPQDGLPPLAPHMHGNHQEPTPSNPETTNGCKL